MTACDRLEDRIPVVAAGDGAWSDEERRHVESCPDCSAAFRLVRMAASLGAPAAAGIDPSRVADRVLARLAAEPGEAGRLAEGRGRSGGGRHAVRVGLAIAASVVLAIAALLMRGGSDPSPPLAREGAPAAAAGGEVRLRLGELEGLTEAELEGLLDDMDTALDPRADDDYDAAPEGEPITWEG